MQTQEVKRSKSGRRIVAIFVAAFVVIGIAGAVFAAGVTPDALADWKERRLAEARERLDARVASGAIDEATADAIYARIQANLAACPATEPGTGLRRGAGIRPGRGFRAGAGCGAAYAGRGAGYGRGACGGAFGAVATPAA